ncbi:MAG TPA: GntR family transcriptional regulator [Usitatibacter sp.]|nr:GntR family transcriptional regulator [Usitatibacter sp.]
MAAVLQPARRSLAPLRAQVLDELRNAIIAGRLAPGARLIERELIDMLGVSRTVVREALRQLQSEGLVAEDARKGMVVRELSESEGRDLYAIRASLEGLAARLFVQKASEAQVRKLEEALQRAVEAYGGGDPRRILRAKNAFYDTLYAGAASETLSSMLAMLHARISRWRALGLSHPKRSPRRSKESIEGLRALIAAIGRRDAARAESIMRDETHKAAAEVLRLIAIQPEEAR